MKRTIITAILTLVLTAFAIHAVEKVAFSGAGVIESTAGGFKFPDGSVQMTAAHPQATQFNYVEMDCTDCPINIPATTGPDSKQSQLTVQNCSEIVEVSLDLDIPHPQPSDMEVSLSKGAVTVTVLRTVGPWWPPTGCPTPDIFVTIDDQASFHNTKCETFSPGIQGILRPHQSLKNFIGLSGNGVWTLTVKDTWKWVDDGSLRDWTLEVLCRNTLQ